jgi:hypothetical protein
VQRKEVTDFVPGAGQHLIVKLLHGRSRNVPALLHHI